MSLRRSPRVRKISVSLTPKQAVIAYLNETLSRYESPEEQARAEAEQLEALPPRDRLARQVEGPVRRALLGDPREFVEQAVRRAVMDADFLFVLHVLTNEAVREQSRERGLHTALVAEQLRALLRVDSKEPSFARRVADWRVEATALAAAALGEDAAIGRIERRFFGGQRLLYPARAEALARSTGRTSEVIDAFNATLGAYLTPICLDAAADLLEAMVRSHETQLIRAAKTHTLLDFGERDRAMAMAWGASRK